MTPTAYAGHRAASADPPFRWLVLLRSWVPSPMRTRVSRVVAIRLCREARTPRRSPAPDAYPAHYAGIWVLRTLRRHRGRPHHLGGRLRRRSRDYVLMEMRSGLGAPSVPLIPLTGGTPSPIEIGRQKTTLSVCGLGAAFQPMIRCRRLQAVGTGVQAIRLSPYPSCTDGPPLHRFRDLPPFPTRLCSPVPFRDFSLLPGRGEVGVYRTSRQCELPSGSTPSRRLHGARRRTRTRSSVGAPSRSHATPRRSAPRLDVTRTVRSSGERSRFLAREISASTSALAG